MKLLIGSSIAILFLGCLLYFFTRQYYIRIGNLGYGLFGWPIWSFGYLAFAVANGIIAGNLIQEMLSTSISLVLWLVINLMYAGFFFVIMVFTIAFSRGKISRLMF